MTFEKFRKSQFKKNSYKWITDVRIDYRDVEDIIKDLRNAKEMAVNLTPQNFVLTQIRGELSSDPENQEIEITGSYIENEEAFEERVKEEWPQELARLEKLEKAKAEREAEMEENIRDQDIRTLRKLAKKYGYIVEDSNR